MKDKIERFSKGEFEYELPYIHISETDIKITVESGKSYEGSFTISNSSGHCMKGVLYSSNRLFTLGSSSFHGVENIVSYHFNGIYLKAGEIVQGEVCIVSDCGEHILPFFVQIEAPYFDTSVGKIRDLFQFTNLARMDWAEAKKLFRSNDFERVFLEQDDKYKVLYRNLLKSISTSQALEEFLIAIRKKSSIRLSIDKTNMEYSITNEGITDKIILTKDHWGYAEIRVSTDSPFIQLEQKFVWADSFISNSYQITFTIDPKHLKTGNNFGRIWVKTVHQTLTVDVVCKNKNMNDSRKADRILMKQYEASLISNYLNFRMEHITLSQYLTKAEALLEGFSLIQESDTTELMKIHMAIISGKDKQAALLLESFSETAVVIRKSSVVAYCAYLYLDALYKKEEENIRFATDTMRIYYEKGYVDWRILWFLLYMDKSYDKNKNFKLSQIKEQFDAGCHSPVLYFEAMCIYNEEPILLRELTEFEIQVMHFGTKYDFATAEVAKQYTYLANKKKKFRWIIYHSLVNLYKEYKSNDILTAICCTLIKGMKKAEKYFDWYQLAVEEQLRITELYEYYMYTINENTDKTIAQSVLLYFVYNSNLNDRKKAYLYSYIIKNKDKLPVIYRTYYKRIELFAMKQLEAHHISKNLATLYEEFIDKNNISNEVANHLPYIMYKHELTCDNPNILSVIVVHKEKDEEEIQTIENGISRINIFTQNADVFLIDTNGNRYSASVDYKIRKLLNSEDYCNQCAEYNNDPKLILQLYEKYQNYQIVTDNAILVREKALQIERLNEKYCCECVYSLIEYYYENYNVEMLEKYLLLVDLDKVKQTIRLKLIEYIIVRDIYDKAISALERFGFEGVSMKRLLKFCSRTIAKMEFYEKNETLLNLCYYVFSRGKYDDGILKYLAKYYYGSTMEMFTLWQTAKSFEIESHELEERLLIQMLFAESYVQDSLQVFKEYYKNITNHMLVRAFLSYYAYKYLINDRVINKELFSIIKRELNYEENDICMLALLKYYTKHPEISDTERNLIEYNLNKFEKKGIVLPFFAEFQKIIKLPERMKDKCYVEYKTNPKNKVYIHYRLLNKDSGESFITELVPNTFMGIHIKEFVLFYQEILQYYITEEFEEEVSITESLHVHFDKEIMEEEDSKYNQINLMLMALEMKDEKTLFDFMEQYVKTEYMISKCFKPIG